LFIRVFCLYLLYIYKKDNMKEHLKKIIKKEVDDILESAGKQDDIYNLSSNITKELINDLHSYIEKHKTKMYDGEPWEFTIPARPTEELKQNTLIQQIIVNVDYTHSDENKITGKLERIKLLDNGFYKVKLKINININDDIDKHFNQVEHWLSHELHHAFRDIKIINKNSKSNRLNWVKNRTSFLTKDFLPEHPSLKEFVIMFYLSLPQEVEARQQETASQLKNYTSENPNKTYEYLMQFQPINDARQMINYSTDEVLKIDKNILRQFVDIFNNNLKEKGLNTWIKKDINDFFNYWKKRIVEAGDVLSKKIDRMISDKHLYKNESELFDHTDLSILSEAYGIDFGDILC